MGSLRRSGWWGGGSRAGQRCARENPSSWGQGSGKPHCEVGSGALGVQAEEEKGLPWGPCSGEMSCVSMDTVSGRDKGGSPSPYAPHQVRDQIARERRAG